MLEVFFRHWLKFNLLIWVLTSKHNVYTGWRFLGLLLSFGPSFYFAKSNRFAFIQGGNPSTMGGNYWIPDSETACTNNSHYFGIKWYNCCQILNILFNMIPLWFHKICYISGLCKLQWWQVDNSVQKGCFRSLLGRSGKKE